MKFNYPFIVLRFREAGTWRALGLFLFSIGLQIPLPVWNHIVLTGSALAGLISVFIPELGSPVTVDPDQIADAMKSAPVGTAPDAARIPVSSIGDHT